MALYRFTTSDHPDADDEHSGRYVLHFSLDDHGELEVRCGVASIVKMAAALAILQADEPDLLRLVQEQKRLVQRKPAE